MPEGSRRIECKVGTLVGYVDLPQSTFTEPSEVENWEFWRAVGEKSGGWGGPLTLGRRNLYSRCIPQGAHAGRGHAVRENTEANRWDTGGIIAQIIKNK